MPGLGRTSPRTERVAGATGMVGALIFGAGVLVGAMVGAGTALLMAPASGAETRAAIRRGSRRMRVRAGDAWDDLRDELRWAARRGRKRLRRQVTRGGWAAEDFMERRRHGMGY